MFAGCAVLVKDFVFKDKDLWSEVVLALDLEGVHDVKLHHPSSSVATSNQ